MVVLGKVSCLKVFMSEIITSSNTYNMMHQSLLFKLFMYIKSFNPYNNHVVQMLSPSPVYGWGYLSSNLTGISKLVSVRVGIHTVMFLSVPSINYVRLVILQFLFMFTEHVEHKT